MARKLDDIGLVVRGDVVTPAVLEANGPLSDGQRCRRKSSRQFPCTRPVMHDDAPHAALSTSGYVYDAWSEVS
jgi:hypothetical protein